MRHHVPLITVAFFAHWTCRLYRTPILVSIYHSMVYLGGDARERRYRIFTASLTYSSLFPMLAFSYSSSYYGIIVLSIIGGLDLLYCSLSYSLLCISPSLYVSYC